jgi:hypothetical protein
VYEPLPQLVQLQELLETARYRQFWATVGDVASVTNDVHGFADAIRQGAPPLAREGCVRSVVARLTRRSAG